MAATVKTIPPAAGKFKNKSPRQPVVASQKLRRERPREKPSDAPLLIVRPPAAASMRRVEKADRKDVRLPSQATP